MNIDKIVEVNIQISEAMSIDGGYDTILIMGPLPKAPGGRTTPDVAGYANLQDLKSAGFASDDPVYIAASKVFGQSPKPTAVMIAVQKLSSGSTEKVDVTLDRAIRMPGWYCICPAGIKEDFYQSIADWTEANEKLCMRDITVGEYQFKVRPFGAKDATYIFGDVASIILPILGTVSVASDDKDAVNMEMFDGMDMDKDSLVKALARINGNALSKLVSELLLDHSNILVLDPKKNTYEVMGEDDFDEIFCQYLAGMLNLCAEVIRLNFSGFFKDASIPARYWQKISSKSSSPKTS